MVQPLLSPAGPREAILMLRDGWKQLLGQQQVWQDAVGRTTADSPSFQAPHGLAWLQLQCFPCTGQQPRSDNAMLLPAPSHPPQRLMATYIMAK